MQLETTILRKEQDDNEVEYELVIDYTFYPLIRGCRDSLGGRRGAGPPLEPDEPAHCEIDKITCEGKEFEVTDEELEALVEEVETHHAERSQPEPPEPDYEPDWDFDR